MIASRTRTAPPSAAAPAAGPEVPAVLPRLAAAAAPAQPSARSPAHVGPQPRLLPVRSSVLAVGHVHPEQALHERAGLQQPGGRVLHNPNERVKARNDLKGLSTSASPSRSRRGRVVSARLYSVQTGLAQTMSSAPETSCSPSSGCRTGL